MASQAIIKNPVIPAFSILYDSLYYNTNSMHMDWQHFIQKITKVTPHTSKPLLKRNTKYTYEGHQVTDSRRLSRVTAVPCRVAILEYTFQIIYFFTVLPLDIKEIFKSNLTTKISISFTILWGHLWTCKISNIIMMVNNCVGNFLDRILP